MLRKLILFALAAVIPAVLIGNATAKESKATATETPAAIQPKEVAMDMNGDGKPDRWERYDNGVLIALEADSNSDGKIDEKGIIENGKLVKIEKDSDFDGKADKWITY